MFHKFQRELWFELQNLPTSWKSLEKDFSLLRWLVTLFDCSSGFNRTCRLRFFGYHHHQNEKFIFRFRFNGSKLILWIHTELKGTKETNNFNKVIFNLFDAMVFVVRHSNVWHFLCVAQMLHLTFAIIKSTKL